MRVKRLIFAALSVTLAMLAPAGPGARASTESRSAVELAQIPASEQPATAIQRLDDEFRKCYAGAKAEILAATSPIIVIAPREVVLYRKGDRTAKEFLPDQYDVMKTFDHLALAIFVTLANHLDCDLSQKTIAQLQCLAKLAGPASDALPSTALSAKEIERQKSIVERSIKFIEQVTEKKRVSAEEERQFAAGISADSMENAYDAVVAELSRLDLIMRQYKDQMTADEWARLKVVVTGPHMPRLQEHKMMYLAALLGDAQEGHRIIYLENSNEEAKALDLTATHILDAKIATAYFNDVERMHRDLLSDAAKRYLKEHPPQ